ncbi:MAG TPA: shikimate kinase [Nitriliruptorales bacterium]
MPRDLALLGMMGVGKSTVARHLAGLMRREVVATDALVEQRAGRTIPQVFADDGEDRFRELEREVIAELADAPPPHRRIIDLGGGAVLDHRNVDSLRRHAELVLLTAPLPVLVARLAEEATGRPLLFGTDLSEALRVLVDERGGVYAAVADHVEQADRPVPAVALEILRWAVHRDGVLSIGERERSP